MEVVLAIYNHPEHYPPTLNAIDFIAKKVKKVHVVYLPLTTNNWQYPENVVHHPVGSAMSQKDFASLGITSKIKAAYCFRKKVNSLLKDTSPQLLLVYDAGALVYSTFLKGIKPIVWYHNHDVLEFDKKAKWSLTKLVSLFQKKAFEHVDFFTLPSKERLQYFPTSSATNSLVIPNYPSHNFYKKVVTNRSTEGEKHLIYQGTISKGHGLEAVIDSLQFCNKDIHLTIIGGENSYCNELITLAEKLDVKHKVHFTGYIKYANLPAETSKGHIGLAINEPGNIIYDTGAQSSNKIYEYAACGLPVVYYNSEHYNAYLKSYEWCIPTNVNGKEISKILDSTFDNYKALSQAALQNFENDLYFEKYFEVAYQKVIQLAKKRTWYL